MVAFGFIVSNGWLRLDSFEKLRRLLLEECRVMQLVDFTGYIFPRANVKTGLVFLEKSQEIGHHMIEAAVTDAASDLSMISFYQIPQRAFLNTYKHIFDLSIEPATEQVKERMRERSEPLETLFHLSFGLKTGDNSRFLTTTATSDHHKPLLRGANIQRYEVNFAGEYVWYVPEEMTAHRRTARPGNAARFEQPKVLIRDTGRRIVWNTG